MTLGQIVTAFPALMRLSTQMLPCRTAYKLKLMTDEAQKHFEFVLEQEKKIISDKNGKIKRDGGIEFPAGTANGAIESLNELRNTDAENWNSPVIEVVATDGLLMSVADIAALEPLIILKECD
jgi:hypothetical protein